MSRSAAHDERNSVLQKAFSSLDEARAKSVPTAVVIPQRAKLLNLPWEVEDVPNGQGAKIHWVGDRNAEKVIYYFHGGGYGLSAFDGHVIFLSQCAERLASKGYKTVIAFLEYGLSKKVKYPVPFIQAIEGLRFILSGRYKPSDIIMGGDSCGGNMAIGAISVLMHGHRSIEPLKLDEPLGGLLLISAWVSFQSESEAYKENNRKDIHMKAQMHEWANDFVSVADTDKYNEPIQAGVSWWKDLPARKTLNIWGTHEIFRDDIKKFGETLEKAGASIEQVSCPLQVHIDCILDAQSGLDVGPMSTKTWKWLETVF